MRNEVLELYKLYCKPKPKIIVKLIDTEKEKFELDNNAESSSNDLYVYLVV